MKLNRSIVLKTAAAGLALAALGTTTVAQARSDVFFSVAANVAPGINIGLSNAPVYYPQPQVYVQPQPVYYQPQSYYVQPAPVYYQPAPFYGVQYVRPGWRHGNRHHGHGYNR